MLTGSDGRCKVAALPKQRREIMFTPESLQLAHDTLVRGVIQAIFQYEDEFKKKVLSSSGWKPEYYTIERCHIANAFRVTLKREDGREKDMYIPSTEVYSWVLELQSTLK